MSAVVLIDTSVFLNVLNVPGFNESRDKIAEEYELRIKMGDTFLLPMATIWETGDHIADLNDGGARYRYAGIFLEQLELALSPSPPYALTNIFNHAEVLNIVKLFPETVKANRKGNRLNKEQRGGISLSDLSIIEEWKRVKKMNNLRQVTIWSLDRDLDGYDFKP